MRIFVYKDKAISKQQFERWQNELSSFLEQHVEPAYFTVETRDFYEYPTQADSDGDLVPTFDWLQSLADNVEKQGEDAFDHVFVFIRKDRWRSGGDFMRELIGDPKQKGIWGSNYSYYYGNQHIHYCRWDNYNMANTFGTSYHEMLHSFDSLIKVETGVEIDPLLGVYDYDACVVHGKCGGYDYVRWKDNTSIFDTLAPHLRNAYRARKERHLEDLKGKISLLRMILKLKRIITRLLNQKNGTSKK